METRHQRTEAEKLKDKAFIEELWILGFTQIEIAKKLSDERGYEVHQQRVSEDLATIKEDYKNRKYEEIAELKTKAIERLELVVKTAFTSFELSKKERKEKMLRKHIGKTETSIKTVETYGDNGFLKTIIEATKLQAKILGIEAPIKIDAKGITVKWHEELTEEDETEPETE
jgi:hypothetical protein